MIWNNKKSILRHGSRDIKAGEVVPADVLKAMGDDRVKQFTDNGTLIKGSEPKQPTERETLVEAAEGMGLQFAKNISVPKLKALIDNEGARVALLNQAKDLKLDVADDATAEVLTAAIDEANAE